MKDRAPTYPGRVKLIPVKGQENVFDMVRADEPKQVGTPLSTQTLFSPETAALFRMDETAVPDDAFKMLGPITEYGRYWWRRRASQSGWYVVVGAETTGTIFYSSNSASVVTVYYSDSYTLNEDGTFSLVSPSSTTVSYVQYNNASRLIGKYFALGSNYTSVDGILKASSSSVVSRETTTGVISGSDTTYTMYSVYLSNVATLHSAYKTETGEWEYLAADSSDAYPSVETNGVEYEFLGVPFENARTAAQIETGSYVGTGEYGEGAPNTLTFGFAPKLVFVRAMAPHSYSGTFIYNADGVTHVVNTGLSGGSVSTTVSGWGTQTLSWYGMSSAYQLNTLSETYYYVAVG